MSYINQLLEFWIATHWSMALVMAILVNSFAYVVTAYLVEWLTNYLVHIRKVGTYINTKECKHGQRLNEIKFGLLACCIFALGSIFIRQLFDKVWPVSPLDLFVQAISFFAFYETYSYFIHRLLHMKLFAKLHSVHHQSVRVTPWTAYSVHPVEAIFIGFSAPLLMCVFPLSLGLILVMHISGMVFTILLHSNYRYTPSNKLVKPLFGYSTYHSKHHSRGNANYGFINSYWDKRFCTNDES